MPVSYDYTLTNGTSADASQVMGNFNKIRDAHNALKWRETKPFLVRGTLTTSDFLAPFPVFIAAGETQTLARVAYKVNGGSATIKVQRNGSDIAGLTGLSVTTTLQSATPSSTVTLADLDLLAIVVTAVSSAADLTFALAIEHGVA